MKLASNQDLLAEAQNWFIRNGSMVSDMQTQQNVDDFENVLHQHLTVPQSRRLLNKGVQVAKKFDDVKIQTTEVNAEIVLHVRGFQRPKTSEEEQNLKRQIVKDLEERYEQKVEFVRFGSIVLFVPQSVYHSLQDDLKGGCVEIAGLTIDKVSWGSELSVSLNSELEVSPQQVLVGLRHWISGLEKPTEPDDLSLDTKTNVDPSLDTILQKKKDLGESEEDVAVGGNKDRSVDTILPKKKDLGESEEDVAGGIVRCQSHQAPSRPLVCAAAAIENPIEEGLLRRFPTASFPRATSFLVPEWIIQAGLSIRQLSQDHEKWNGVTGSDGTFLMVEHPDQPELQIEISNIEEAKLLLQCLEWVSSSDARVWKAGPQEEFVGQSISVPPGYMTSLPRLQQCFGLTLSHGDDGNLVSGESAHQCASWPQTIVFSMPKYDVCPTGKTTFGKGDRVVFGSREKSFRYIPVDDAIAIASLADDLNDQMVLTREVTLTTARGAVRLLPESRFLGSKSGDASPLLTGKDSLKPRTTLVFEVSPDAILQHNFPDASPQTNCRFDLDYFRVKHKSLEGPLALRDPGCLVSRSKLRINVVGVARQVTQKDGQIVFSIDYCSGPESQVQNDDLILLPRVPGPSGVSDSTRIWLDDDVRSVANVCPEFDRHLCTICTQNPKNSLLVKCGHTVCSECAKECGVKCPFCRAPVDHVVGIFD